MSTTNTLSAGTDYRDKRGRTWTVMGFLSPDPDGRPWFISDPAGSHVHIMTTNEGGKRKGKFVKVATFIASLVETETQR